MMRLLTISLFLLALLAFPAMAQEPCCDHTGTITAWYTACIFDADVPGQGTMRVRVAGIACPAINGDAQELADSRAITLDMFPAGSAVTFRTFDDRQSAAGIYRGRRCRITPPGGQPMRPACVLPRLNAAWIANSKQWSLARCEEQSPITNREVQTTDCRAAQARVLEVCP